MKRVERRLVVAITGASGSIYAVRFLEAVLEHYDRICLIVTENAATVIRAELGIDFPSDKVDALSLLGKYSEKVEVLSAHDLTAPPASGSFQHQGMVIIPCSMGTAGRIAAGISNDLVTRAADVCLKERRPLILVIRETPLSLIHLRSLTSLAEAGATILPAAPAFYSKPKTVEDMVCFVVSRTMQQLGLTQTMLPEWGSTEK
ncbi:MAG TPA: flavin prenyltransferase UbiX [Armatimonadota bacterium]|nr:flavin prenyltransferase UbiX [Armatimonadota bacterium]